MNPMKKSFLLLLVLAVALLAGCSLDNNKCVSYDLGSVMQTDTPDSVQVNQNVNIDITYSCLVCAGFDNFQQYVSGDTLDIAVITKSEECVCAEALHTQHVTYSFRAELPGTYYLRFYQSDTSYLTDTLVVY